MSFWQNILAWDRSMVLAVNEIHTPFLDHFFWLISETAVWLPAMVALLYVIIKNKKVDSIWIIAAIALMFVFVDQVAAEIIKPLVGRPRPTHDMLLIPYLETVNGYRGGHYGFVSNHAANVFAFATFSSLLFKNRPYTICLLLWACLVSFSRSYLAVHFPTDLLCGAAFGALSAWAFYWVYAKLTRVEHPDFQYNRFQYTKSLYKKQDIYILLIILATILTSLLLAAYYIN